MLAHQWSPLFNMHEGQLEAKVMAAQNTKVKAIPCNIMYGPHAP